MAQNTDSLTVKNEQVLVVKDSLSSNDGYEPLAPATAAFYSAVLPGLGQAYNKKYWKIPIIYAGMATGIYFYVKNDDDYDRFRDAYKSRLAGYDDDEFVGITDDQLIDAQKTAQKNKSISIMVTVAFYLANIIDANVDAHLRQYNVSEDLSIQPSFDIGPMNPQASYGISLKYSLK